MYDVAVGKLEGSTFKRQLSFHGICIVYQVISSDFCKEINDVTKTIVSKDTH